MADATAGNSQRCFLHPFARARTTSVSKLRAFFPISEAICEEIGSIGRTVPHMLGAVFLITQHLGPVNWRTRR